jgi:hypothetical protein
MAETLSEALGLEKPPKYEGLDPRWLPYVDQKVIVIMKAGNRMTGFAVHYGTVADAHINVRGRCHYVHFDDIKSISFYLDAPTKLKNEELLVGHTYRSNRPRYNIFNEPDDRYVLWIGGDNIQYDSVSVAMGRHLPVVKIHQFLRWAASDVTKQIEAAKAEKTTS